MSYYPTLAEDVQRAKAILAEGRADTPRIDATSEVQRQMQALAGGTIFGKDTYAAYKLLESFVEVLRDVAASGHEDIDPRLDYVEVQIDRHLWTELRAALD